VQLWGGPSWQRQLKINHGGVKLLDFSPCEHYLVTWSPEGDQKEALIVWDVRTGAKCRAFVGAGEDGVMENWPAFRWSHDDQFFARLGDDCIYVYESSTMKLIKDKNDKRSSIKELLPDNPHRVRSRPNHVIRLLVATGGWGAAVHLVADGQHRLPLDPGAPQQPREGASSSSSTSTSTTTTTSSSGSSGSSSMDRRNSSTPHLPASPHTSPHLRTRPHISPHLPRRSS